MGLQRPASGLHLPRHSLSSRDSTTISNLLAWCCSEPAANYFNLFDRTPEAGCFLPTMLRSLSILLSLKIFHPRAAWCFDGTIVAQTPGLACNSNSCLLRPVGSARCWSSSPLCPDCPHRVFNLCSFRCLWMLSRLWHVLLTTVESPVLILEVMLLDIFPEPILLFFNYPRSLGVILTRLLILSRSGRSPLGSCRCARTELARTAPPSKCAHNHSTFVPHIHIREAIQRISRPTQHIESWAGPCVVWSVIQNCRVTTVFGNVVSRSQNNEPVNVGIHTTPFLRGPSAEHSLLRVSRLKNMTSLVTLCTALEFRGAGN